MFKKLLAIGMSLVMLFSFVGCGNSSTTQSSGKTQNAQLKPVKFRLNFTATGLHSPFYMALAKGYYKQAGLDVTIGEGTGSGTTAKLVGTGSDDLGLVDSASAGAAVAQGIPIKIVCPVYAVNAFGIISNASAGINTPKDMEGKKIGITTGDGPANLIAAVAAANNVDVKKIHFITMDANSKVTALAKGQVDAILGGADNEAITAKNMGVDVKVLRYSDYGAATVGLSIIASENYMKNNPEVIKKFIAATMKAWNDARKNPDGTVKYILDKFPTMNKDTALGGLKVALGSLFAADSKTQGDLSENDWENCRTLLVKYMHVKDSVKATDLYTKDYLPDNLPSK